MTARDLEVFAAVAEHGSMSAAARALRVSQSSVSQAVADIEREYGVLLFDRCAHSLHLTPTGETLLAYAQKTLFLVREIDGFLRSGTCRSELRVGVSNTHEIVDLLLKSRLDVGLVEGRVDHPGLAVRPALEDRLVIVCPPVTPFSAVPRSVRRSSPARPWSSGRRAPAPGPTWRRPSGAAASPAAPPGCAAAPKPSWTPYATASASASSPAGWSGPIWMPGGCGPARRRVWTCAGPSPWSSTGTSVPSTPLPGSGRCVWPGAGRRMPPHYKYSLMVI